MKQSEIVIRGCYIAMPDFISVIPQNILPATGKQLYAALANYNGENEEAYPGQKRLALELGINRDRIGADITILMDLQLVTKRPTYSTDHYTLLPPPRELVELAAHLSEVIKQAYKAKQKPDYKALTRHRTEVVNAWLARIAYTPAPTGKWKKRGYATTTSGGSKIDPGQKVTHGSIIDPSIECLPGKATECLTGQAFGCQTGQALDCRTGQAEITPSNHSTESHHENTRIAAAPLPPPAGPVPCDASLSPSDESSCQVSEDGKASSGSEDVKARDVQAAGTSPSGATPAKQSPLKTEMSGGSKTSSQKNQKPAPAARLSKNKRRELSDEMKTLIKSDIKQMNRYLFYGADAVGKPKELLATMRKSPMYFWLDESDPTGWCKWTMQQFVGFFWYRVCKYRHERGMSIDLPPVGELIGKMQNILATDGYGWGYTTEKLYRHILELTHYFDLIQLMCRGMTLNLDSTALMHRTCREKLDVIRQVPEADRGQYWVDWQKRRGAYVADAGDDDDGCWDEAA